MSSCTYSHLLSPLPVGNVLLKNRMIATAATPHFLQGTEPYPTEKWITMMVNRARNGAAVVNINHIEDPSPANGDPFDTRIHFCKMDSTNTAAHNYLCQMIDGIRFYGSLATTDVQGSFKMEGPPPPMANGAAGVMELMPGPIDYAALTPAQRRMKLPEEPAMCNSCTKAQMQEFIDSSVEYAKFAKMLGFEMFSIHNAYRAKLPAQFWSPITNHRHDRYGADTVENRARFMVELFDAIRQTVGRDFPIEALVSGCERNGGITVQDTIALSRLLEGKVDVIHIRQGEQDPQHPTGYTSTRAVPCPNLETAAAVKEAIRQDGRKMLVAVSSGLQDPAFCDAIIRDGKADIIASARTWICDPEYGKKVYAGAGEDVRPCVRCNKCHVPNDSEKYRSYCSVNPILGLEDKISRMVEPVGAPKKVGIVGGGPAGLQAAMTAADRGHQVVLFEKSNALGGQLKHADYASFKWPLANFKDYLIRQCEKRNIEIRLNTDATPELLKELALDELIVAIGPRFCVPPIAGNTGDHIWQAVDVFGRHKELPRKVIVIGGSDTGVDTAMYLAENGHDVSIMTRQGDVATDAPHAHFVAMLRQAFDKMEQIKPIYSVRQYLEITASGVRYLDQSGDEQFEAAEAVVFAAGTKARPEDAAIFFGCAPRTQYIGDCKRASNLHFAVQHGFAAASQI